MQSPIILLWQARALMTPAERDSALALVFDIGGWGADEIGEILWWAMRELNPRPPARHGESLRPWVSADVRG